MPSIAQSYEVILDFTNDTHDAATVQLLRDYGCHSNRILLLNPGESISLVLDAGDSYKYTVKTKSKVVNVTYVLLFRVTLPTGSLTRNAEPEHGETSCADYPSSSPLRPTHGLQPCSQPERP